MNVIQRQFGLFVRGYRLQRRDGQPVRIGRNDEQAYVRLSPPCPRRYDNMVGHVGVRHVQLDPIQRVSVARRFRPGLHPLRVPASARLGQRQRHNQPSAGNAGQILPLLGFRPRFRYGHARHDDGGKVRPGHQDAPHLLEQNGKLHESEFAASILFREYQPQPAESGQPVPELGSVSALIPAPCRARRTWDTPLQGNSRALVLSICWVSFSPRSNLRLPGGYQTNQARAHDDAPPSCGYSVLSKRFDFERRKLRPAGPPCRSPSARCPAPCESRG